MSLVEENSLVGLNYKFFACKSGFVVYEFFILLMAFETGLLFHSLNALRIEALLKHHYLLLSFKSLKVIFDVNNCLSIIVSLYLFAKILIIM